MRLKLKLYYLINQYLNNTNKYLNSERYTVDNKKIKSLGFISKTSMSTGINEIFEYLDSINNEK